MHGLLQPLRRGHRFRYRTTPENRAGRAAAGRADRQRQFSMEVLGQLLQVMVEATGGTFSDLVHASSSGSATFDGGADKERSNGHPL
jgi:hypothetical protein